jgi:phosphohistidine swiveling domain-containing protein
VFSVFGSIVDNAPLGCNLPASARLWYILLVENQPTTARPTPFIVPLIGTGAWTAAEIGGKGVNLDTLIRLGFEVPAGFCVTTRTFREALRLWTRGPGGGDLVQRILERPFPPRIERELRDAAEGLLRMAGTGLAARSSATEEDQDERSMAGQNETVLNITTPDGVLAAIRRCWASLFSRESILYRATGATGDDNPEMAVVVQQVVPAAAAGVLFTENPMDPGEMLLSASPGLGETVVSGRAVDTWYLDRAGEVLRAQIAEKPTLLAARSTGGVEEQTRPAHLTRRPTLDPARIQVLAALGRRVEARIGGPQDIEWALWKDRVYLLQTRPITGRDNGTAARTVWSNVNVGEALPGVGTPFTWSIIRAFSRLGFERAFSALGCTVPRDYGLIGGIRGRVYLNLSEFMSVASQIPLLSPGALFEAGGGGGLEALPGTYRKLSPAAFLARLPATGAKLLASQATAPARVATWSPRFRAFRERFYRTPFDRLEDRELRSWFDRVEEVFNHTGALLLEVSSHFLMSYVLTAGMLQATLGDEGRDLEKQLYSGLSGLRSAEPGLDLLRMARRIARDPALRARVIATPPEALRETLESDSAGRTLLAAFDAFLASHGHRAIREAELSVPRWSEDPTFPLGVLGAYLGADHLPDPDAMLASRQQAREGATREVLDRLPRGTRTFFLRLLRTSQRTARTREALRSDVVHTMAFYRRLALEVGQRMAADGRLPAAEDVFLLHLDEIVGVAEHREDPDLLVRVESRRLEHRAFLGIPDPPDWFVLERGRILPRTTPQDVFADATGDGPLLEGLGGSPGIAVGRACVVREAADRDLLQAGDILVAPYTDVGWTPLFLLTAGVVTDLGGPLSHSCVVAREYGIPTVVNVKRGTELIRTGDRIRVDGSKGTVERLRSTDAD